MKKTVLITGSAGFIGFHLVKAMLNNGYHVVGIDNINDYYDQNLKLSRLENINEFIDDSELKEKYKFIKLDITDNTDLQNLFSTYDIDIVIHLAAHAGVRYSIENPKAFVDSNIVGFTNLLECCKQAKIEHFVYASSSSVYGMNTKQPFSTSDNTDYPVSLYAATKKSNELLAYSYSHLFNMPCTGLRFFTVYGPYGRPDMAYYLFAKAICEGRPIDVFNNGNMKRDFTYIDDIVEGILLVTKKIPSRCSPETSDATAPFKVFNIGNNEVITLGYFIEQIELALSKKAIINMMPMQDGDVPLTYADIDDMKEEFDFNPNTSIEDGIQRFVEWYLNYNAT
ncbi:GDP-mannose 4,6-dehydratase [Woeseiaceae bacterium]|jgi:UDP-glucuronate 4-epimerase|nr:GDP-mannose 4,6-dehydratase [Woeseiaceae bacterium]